MVIRTFNEGLNGLEFVDEDVERYQQPPVWR